MTLARPAPHFDYDGDVFAFPLAWRWTRPEHEVFTPDELRSVRPLRAESASAASEYARALQASADSAARQATRAVGESDGELRGWLSGLPVPGAERVVLSWSPSLAVETSWEQFVSRWSTFWYPSSDDLVVFPASGSWLLRAAHYGEFEWMPVTPRPS